MLLSEDGLSLPDMPKKRYLQGTTQMYYRDQKSTHVIVVHMQSIFRTSVVMPVTGSLNSKSGKNCMSFMSH